MKIFLLLYSFSHLGEQTEQKKKIFFITPPFFGSGCTALHCGMAWAEWNCETIVVKWEERREGKGREEGREPKQDNTEKKSANQTETQSVSNVRYLLFCVSSRKKEKEIFHNTITRMKIFFN